MNIKNVFVFYFAFMQISSVVGQTIPTQDIKTKYKYLLSGMDDARQRLRTGQYRATGRFTQENSTSSNRLDGPVTLFSAFDVNVDKFRFDRTEPIPEVMIAAPAGSTLGSWKKNTKGGKMIKLSDRIISNLEGSFQVDIGDMYPMTEDAIKPLDVRAFGLFFWKDLGSFPAKTYPQWLEILERDNPNEIVSEGRGIWRITWDINKFEPLKIRRITWLDEKSGYSPIRLELKYLDELMSSGEWPEPSYVSETTWVEIDKTWVPKTCRVVDKQVPHTVQSYDLSFDWEIVNGTIPEHQFTIEGLQLSQNDVVSDHRLGLPIIIGKIGPDHKLVEEAATPAPSSGLRHSGIDLGAAFSYFAVAVGIGLLALVAWLKWRSGRGHHSPD